MAIALDDVDVSLLTALQQDADRTNQDLARLVGLSPAATLHRVRRLKETGVIRIVCARVDAASAGFPLTVFIAVGATRNDLRSTRRFEQELAALPQVVAADSVAGEMDYWLTVVARDVEDLERVLMRIATHGGQKIVTYLRLKEIKPPSPLPLVATSVTARRRATTTTRPER